LLASARQGQIVLSAAAAAQLRAQPAPPELRDWGVRRLIDLLPPEHMFALADGEPDLEPQTLDAAPTNLPAQPTALIGREQALREVAGLLRQPATRLLTLTGPGGIGKTRLAVHAAAQLLGSFPDGVWFVDLAPLHQPDQLLPAIAQAAGLGDGAAAEIGERLAAALRDKAVLLVLDNAEHMPDAAPVLADQLARLPALRMLVTSRERLRLSNEYEFVVPPLALGFDRDRPFDPLAYPEAVRLFLARAPAGTQGVPGPDEGDVASIAAICQRLDGLPLAIELAAARSKIFSPAALLARLHNSLPLLTGGSRDLPARQQTLRGAIAWSYDLLSPAEQALLRRLAVFVGGWEIEALEHICPDPAPDGALDAAACLDGLTSLIDKSLVHQAEGDAGHAGGAEPRFRLLQTIRDFALEQLEAAGELTALRARHCRYYAGLAEASEPGLRSSQQQGWLARLTYEQENLRAALHWSLEEDRDAAARLAGSLWRFWMMRSQWTEGRMWISAALAGGEELAVARRATLLLAEGALAHRQGDVAHSAVALTESVAAWEQTADRIGKALALNALGSTRRVQGLFDEAQRLFAASLAVWRDLDDPAGISTVLHNMGTIFSHRGEHQQARPHYEEAVNLQRRHGLASLLASSLDALGYTSSEEGDFARASALYGESFDLHNRLGNRAGIALGLINFAEVAYAQGQFDHAERLLAQSAAAAQGIDDLNHRLYWTLNTAALAFERGRHAEAQRLFEEGLTISQRQGNTFRQVATLVRLAHLALVDRRMADGEAYLRQALAL
ncbi:MAG TPA: tetratricopeptide repeat protein, partial [Herpetosiphonaceae bacterium]